MGTSGFGTPGHLARRFVGSLRPGGPSIAEDAWARRWFNTGESDVWKTMSGPDRRHAVGVARRVAASMGNQDGAGVPTQVLAAALLHDAGKVVSGLGTFGRAAATVAAVIVGRDRVAGWASPGGGGAGADWRRRAGDYVTHDRLGSDLLAAAGSSDLVIAWAREHHLAPAEWTIDAEVAGALKAADDD